MKKICFLSLFVVVCLSTVFAQHLPGDGVVYLKNGRFSGGKNLLKTKPGKETLPKIHFSRKYYTLIKFSAIPDAAVKSELNARGIMLFDYIPGNAYLAEIPDSLNTADLVQFHVNGLYAVDKQYKIAKNVSDHISDFINNTDQPLAVSFFGSVTKEQVTRVLIQSGASIVETKIQPPHIVFINADGPSIGKIATLPFVSFISAQHVKAVSLNYNNRAAHSLDALNAVSGRNLQGKNVTIGIGDDADPSSHIDFAGRLILRTPEAFNLHGTHTTGTLAGGGILDPKYRGMASKATIVAQSFYDIIVNAPTYLQDYNMVLTNNSYSVYNPGCPDGAYDVFSNYADDQMNIFDSLLHVFASGNDGLATCSPYPAYFGTVKSGFQVAKNVLTVGATNNADYTNAYFTSRGPSNDGRIKPEIVAGGIAIVSTIPNNQYTSEDGTSMSAPTVTGALALLYERYRQLHGGLNPSAALAKAIVCNSADDLGNPGPDYTFGYGMLNARTAVETIENNHYFTGNIANGGASTFTISGMPAGVRQLKVMLYWSDPAASLSAATQLVNDLDLTVTGTDGISHRPRVLNANPANVNDSAIEGTDNLNNIEQVVIDNPPAGNFTLAVNGTNIPAGPQNFVIAYEIINPSVTVEYPFGNETLVPGETENIRWSSYGGTGNSFTVEYSLNNGSTWNTIAATVPDGSRTYPWVVPDTPTNNGLIRVTRNNVGYTDISDYNFSILRQPAVTYTNPCQGYVKLLWRSIPSATTYDVMMLKGDSMQAIASITDTTYLVSGLNKDSTYWLSVRGVNNGVPGRRAIAGDIMPNGGSCTLISKDLSVDSLVAPVSGRQFTSTQLSGTAIISVQLKNLGSLSTSGSYPISYQVNGGTVVTETVSTVIASNGTTIYSFTTSADFSAVGNYDLKVWVSYTGDTLHANDTIHAVIRQLQNDPVMLTPTFTEGFESATDADYFVNTTGLTGLDRVDFRESNSNGRVRTFVNTGFPRSGVRALTLDQAHLSASSTADSAITTFNLSNYLPTEQIWMDFYCLNHGIDFNLPGNKVWIRGNDQAAWLPVLTLPATAASFGVYQPSGSIDVTGILSAATPAQAISSSFQVKFGEEGYTSANSVIPDGNLDDGYSFDDITLTRSLNDAALVALVNPVNVCQLSNAEVVQVKVKNYSTNTLTNIAVSYDINGTIVTENIPTLAPKDSLIYSFTHTADFSVFRHYTVSAWVNCTGDTYHVNDSVQDISFQTAPLIASFPYLQGFENDNGNWFTDGTNDSWEWGVPAKTIINKAANGTKAWVTALTGTYNNNELSYLYSPCFNLSSLTQPVFSFSHIFQTEDDCDCDYHWVEYSTDDVNWVKLGAVGGGTNWYDNSARQAWQLSDSKWHVSSYDVPVTAAKVRFRIVMNSDPGVTYEGIGIDDVHVFEKNAIYSGVNTDAGITQNVSGTNWVNFSQGGHIVAAINPNGQDLGSTTVYAYMNTAAARHTVSQYYLDRNLVIKPANQPADSVSVRFYFLNTEVNNLIHATGCPACTTIGDAYQAGITQYSNMPAQEDSTLNNNIGGVYRYILPHSGVNVVPNDNGYYAEYKVGGFSEFWINNGGLSQNQPLPVVLETFTATRTGSDEALLKWTISDVDDLSAFAVEKSVDGVNFSEIGLVKERKDSAGVYRFTDNNLFNGTNYYRLKIEGPDGNFQYSPIRTVVADRADIFIHIFPNPVSKGNVYITSSSNCNSIRLSDMTGRIIKEITTTGVQNTFSMESISKGVYMITVYTDAGMKVEKLVVE